MGLLFVDLSKAREVCGSMMVCVDAILTSKRLQVGWWGAALGDGGGAVSDRRELHGSCR